MAVLERALSSGRFWCRRRKDRSSMGRIELHCGRSASASCLCRVADWLGSKAQFLCTCCNPVGRTVVAPPRPNKPGACHCCDPHLEGCRGPKRTHRSTSVGARQHCTRATRRLVGRTPRPRYARAPRRGAGEPPGVTQPNNERRRARARARTRIRMKHVSVCTVIVNAVVLFLVFTCNCLSFF